MEVARGMVAAVGWRTPVTCSRWLFAVAFALVVACRVPASEGGSRQDVDEHAAVNAALDKATRWLLAHEDDAGAFQPARRPHVCAVALTAVALWALCESEKAPTDAAWAMKVGSFLHRYRQPDGGIYDPEKGIAVYTSGVASRALRAFGGRYNAPHVGTVLSGLDLFVYRQGGPESLIDAPQSATTSPGRVAQEARALLSEPGEMSAEEREAVAFLARLPTIGRPRLPYRFRFPRTSSSTTGDRLSYDELLPLVYQPVKSHHTLALRARRAIQAFYTLDRNPDLTKRYGEDGFQPGTQGLYYYYMVVAATLSAFKTPTIELRCGETRQWARELTQRLLSLQHSEGYWVNADGEWWEDEPVLVTSYAVLALTYCRAVSRSSS